MSSTTTSFAPRVIRRGSSQYRVMVAVGLVALVILIFLGGQLGVFRLDQLAKAMIFAIAIAGLNIATGYGGMVSVGHSAFFGLGAYTTGILVTRYEWRAEYGIPVAVVVCFVVGVVVGLPALRIRGLYLAIVTLALGVAFPEVINRFAGFTGGAGGVTIRRKQLVPPTWTGIPVKDKTEWLYWLAVAMLLLVTVVVSLLMKSRWGMSLIATRDNEIAASASGVNLAVVKPVAFGVSAAITGIGGALFAMYLTSFSAETSFTLVLAIQLITGLVIGGEATRLGPILGGAAVVYIPDTAGNIGSGQAAAVLFGVTLIAIVFVAPRGIAGFLYNVTRRFLVVLPPQPDPELSTFDLVGDGESGETEADPAEVSVPTA